MSAPALRFTVLGSGTAVPDPARGAAGFLVEVGDLAWLVDGGTGTLRRCAQAGRDPRTLDGGVYSHFHPDHCADLVPLLFAMRMPPERARDYPIVAGAGFRRLFDGLCEAWGKWIRPAAGVSVTELSLDGPDEVVLGPLTLTTRPANHSAGALHLRFEAGGRAVVFSGDTGPSEALAALAAGADLLVCECASSPAAPIPGHLDAHQVAAIVDQARPAAVWLTHLYPEVDPEHALRTVAATGVPVRRADDLDRFE
ncbi:MAG: ribonuclease Z [Myxococcota bacterium]